MNCRIEASRVKTNWKINEFIFSTHQIYSFRASFFGAQFFIFIQRIFASPREKIKTKPPFTLNRSHLERPVFCSLFTVVVSLLIFHDSCVKMILSKSINGPTFNFGFSLWYHLPSSYQKASIFKKRKESENVKLDFVRCSFFFFYYSLLWYPANPSTYPALRNWPPIFFSLVQNSMFAT